MQQRYVRQEQFVPIGKEGQLKLSQKHVLIIGAGALGSGNADILARAGVGTISIVDRDYVEWSNLQRQSLYVERDAERQLPKAEVAARRLRQINRSIEINAHIADCTPQTMQRLVSGVDLIIDATDNFATRFLINDIAYQHHMPWIHGACVGSYGLSFTFIPGNTPCLACLLTSFPTIAGSCDIDGIIAPTVQMVVSYQTSEALKLLSGNEQALSGRLTVFDLWKNTSQSYKVSKAIKYDHCSTCGKERSYPHLQPATRMESEVLCGRDTVWIRASLRGEIEIEQLAQKLQKQGKRVVINPFLLSFDDEHLRLVIFRDGRALIHGTAEPVEAKKIYHRYVG